MRLDREGLSSLVGMWGGGFLNFCCWYWHSVVPRWLPPDVTHNSRKLSQMPRFDKQRGRNSFPRIFTRGSFSSWVCWSCHKQYNRFHQALLFPRSWSMRWAGFFISHIMFGCLCGSAKTDVFRKLMNEDPCWWVVSCRGRWWSYWKFDSHVWGWLHRAASHMVTATDFLFIAWYWQVMIAEPFILS